MKLFKITAGLIISAVCLCVVFKDFQFSELKIILSHVQWFWFAPALCIFVFNHLLRSFRWRLLLMPIQTLSPFFLYPILVFGFMVNAAMPARAGEFARALALNQKTNIKVGSSLGTVAAERVMDLLGLFALALMAIGLIPQDTLPIHKIFITLIMAVALIGLFIFLVERYGHVWRSSASKLVVKIIDFVTHVAAGFASFKSPGKMVLIILLTLAVWLNEALCIYFIARAFYLGMSYKAAVVLLVGVCVGYMIPGAPGAVGTVDFFGKQTLLLLGYAPGIAVSFILILHLYQLAAIFALGIPCAFKVGFSKEILSVPSGVDEKK